MLQKVQESARVLLRASILRQLDDLSWIPARIGANVNPGDASSR